MAELTLELTDEELAKAMAQARRSGYLRVEEYIVSLMDDAEARGRYEVRSDDELEAKLLEGLESGPGIPVNEAFWEDLRQRVRERTGDSTAW